MTKPKTTLILKTLPPDMRAYRGFQWPDQPGAVVQAKRWDPTPTCGDGLHGLAHGEGSADLLHRPRDPDTRWVVFEARTSTVVDLDGKVKVPAATVRFVGDRDAALEWLAAHDEPGHYPVFGTATASDGGAATAGDGGTAIAGDGGAATAGDGGTAIAGDVGAATAGDWGTATTGDWGTATTGDRGTATAGERGTANAGAWGTANAGAWGVIELRWWDGARYRVAVGYVGEGGIKPNVPYRCDDRGRLVAVEVTA